MKRISRFAASLTLLLSFSAAAHAHNVPYSYLNVKVQPTGMVGTLSAHAKDFAAELGVSSPTAVSLQTDFWAARKDTIQAIVNKKLLVSVDGKLLPAQITAISASEEQKTVDLKLRYDWTALPAAVHFQRELFSYDPKHEMFVNFTENEQLRDQEVLKENADAFDYYTGTTQGTLTIVKRFVEAGMHHIFTGPDHMLFILGLLLLGGSLRRLLTIVTSFTIAHSITLGLAALHIVSPSARLVDILVAASIVYIGLENLRAQRSGAGDRRALVSFYFGLVHGFGFATVLSDFGLPRQALALSLGSFNLGVECAQASIICAAAPVLLYIRKRDAALGDRICFWGSIGVSLAGCGWLVQRAFFP